MTLTYKKKVSFSIPQSQKLISQSGRKLKYEQIEWDSIFTLLTVVGHHKVMGLKIVFSVTELIFDTKYELLTSAVTYHFKL